ncbi:MAG: dfrA [Gammaproteobacteria bacterium]|nr:dfrA [Gammaproteobacteria bacterium]
MSTNRVIGKNNQLPWHLPADLKHFKKITLGKPILMGRKTYESIGRPLPGRCNIVISRDKNFQAPGCIITHSIESALAIASEQENEEIFIIGGALLFQETLPITQRLYLTVIHHEIQGDTYFPELKLTEWQEVECEDHEPDTENNYSYSFKILDRK